MFGASIYILRCADGSYYTGIMRRSVEEWVSEHFQGLVDSYTAGRLPVELIFSEYYERLDEAIAAAADQRLVACEKGSLHAGEFNLLSVLSRRKSKGPSS
jgi:putative endonuclease